MSYGDVRLCVCDLSYITQVCGGGRNPNELWGCGVICHECVIHITQVCGGG